MKYVKFLFLSSASVLLWNVSKWRELTGSTGGFYFIFIFFLQFFERPQYKGVAFVHVSVDRWNLFFMNYSLLSSTTISHSFQRWINCSPWIPLSMSGYADIGKNRYIFQSITFNLASYYQVYRLQRLTSIAISFCDLRSETAQEIMHWWAVIASMLGSGTCTKTRKTIPFPIGSGEE